VRYDQNYVGLQVKYPLCLTGFDETWIFCTDFYIKSHESPSSGSRVIPCGQTDGQTDVKRPIIDFRKFANAPKIADRYQPKSYTDFRVVTRFFKTLCLNVTNSIQQGPLENPVVNQLIMKLPAFCES
jgi:hypothetical protein